MGGRVDDGDGERECEVCGGGGCGTGSRARHLVRAGDCRSAVSGSGACHVSAKQHKLTSSTSTGTVASLSNSPPARLTQSALHLLPPLHVHPALHASHPRRHQPPPSTLPHSPRSQKPPTLRCIYAALVTQYTRNATTKSYQTTGRVPAQGSQGTGSIHVRASCTNACLHALYGPPIQHRSKARR